MKLAVETGSGVMIYLSCIIEFDKGTNTHTHIHKQHGDCMRKMTDHRRRLMRPNSCSYVSVNTEGLLNSVFYMRSESYQILQTENTRIRGINLAAIRRTTVQVTIPPPQQNYF
jgi:hypothetical protein